MDQQQQSIFTTIFVIVAAIMVFTFLSKHQSTKEGYTNQQIAETKNVDEIETLDEQFNDIAQGNPISYANKQNPDRATQEKTHDNENIPVYFGTPLDLETTPMQLPPKDQTMTYFARHEAHLDCCPSNYSTDQGCVCWSPPMPSNKSKYYSRANSAITP